VIRREVTIMPEDSAGEPMARQTPARVVQEDR
jgi:hypothetical protein